MPVSLDRPIPRLPERFWQEATCFSRDERGAFVPPQKQGLDSLPGTPRSGSRSATARARKIKLILFDVDGVLTDGKIWIFPAPGGSQAGGQQSVLEKSAPHGGQGGFGLHSTSLIEAKGFAHDGTAISLARLAGIKTGIITKRISETVALRARDLKIDHVYQGIQDKASVFTQILQKDGITAAEAAFCGR